MKKETYPKTPEIALKHSKDKGRQRKKSFIIENIFFYRIFNKWSSGYNKMEIIQITSSLQQDFNK